MTEVDPIILVSVSAAVIVGLAAIVFCNTNNKKAQKSPNLNVAANKENLNASSDSKTPKKKNKSKAKKVAVVQEVAQSSDSETPTTPPGVVAVDTEFELEVTTKKSKTKSKSSKKNKNADIVPSVVTTPKVVVDVSHEEDSREKIEVDKVNASVPESKNSEILYSFTDLSSAKFSLSPAQDVNSVEDWATVEIKKPKLSKKTPSSSSVKATEPSTTIDAETQSSSSSLLAPVAPIDRVTQTITVEAKKIGAVIGPKGKFKIAIQEALDVEIVFPKSSTKESTEPAEVSVIGAAENVPKAIKAIQDLVTKGFSAIIEGEDFRETLVSVPSSFLSDIIGKGGANIKAIQEKLQVRVTIPPTPVLNNKSDNKVTNVKIAVSGQKESVIKTKALIKELVQFYHTPITHPGYEHVEMDVEPQYFNYIIGAKGSEIKHIQGNFKVSVHVPSTDSVCKNLLIVGLPNNIEGARKYVLKIIDNVDQGRRKANEVNKEWMQGDPVNESNNSTSPEITTSTVTGANGEATTRTNEVWFEDLLLNAKRVPGSTIHKPSSNLNPSQTAAIPGPAPTAATATDVQANSKWTSNLLSSNDGW